MNAIMFSLDSEVYGIFYLSFNLVLHAWILVSQTTIDQDTYVFLPKTEFVLYLLI